MRNSLSLLILSAFLALPFSVKADQLPMKQFLARARRANQIATYAKLHGQLQHRRKGKDLISMPIYFGVILHPEHTAGQLVLNNDEAYIIGQARNSGLTSVTPAKENTTDKLGYVGVRASDLTMSFLFCEPEKELESDTVGGVVKCRVLLLDDKANKEKVKVWIAAEHAFPVQAEFYRYGENKPFRILEAGDFTQKNDLYYVKKIRLEGPGWRTRIDFDNSSAEVDKYDPANAPRILMNLQKK